MRLLRGDNIGQGVLRWENATSDGAQTTLWTSDMQCRRAISADRDGSSLDRCWAQIASVTERDLPAWLVQRVARLRAKPGVDQRYLHYLFASRDFHVSHLGGPNRYGDSA